MFSFLRSKSGREGAPSPSPKPSKKKTMFRSPLFRSPKPQKQSQDADLLSPAALPPSLPHAAGSEHPSNNSAPTEKKNNEHAEYEDCICSPFAIASKRKRDSDDEDSEEEVSPPKKGKSADLESAGAALPESHFTEVKFEKSKPQIEIARNATNLQGCHMTKLSPQQQSCARKLSAAALTAGAAPSSPCYCCCTDMSFYVQR